MSVLKLKVFGQKTKIYKNFSRTLSRIQNKSPINLMHFFLNKNK